MAADGVARPADTMIRLPAIRLSAQRGLALAASLFAALLVVEPAPARAVIDVPFQDVTVRSKRIEAFRIGRADEPRFGELTFLGGLELLSGNRHMGGLSGLVLSPDGSRMTAIADNGLWFTATIDAEPDGRPLAVRDAQLSAIVGPDGRPLMDRGRGDAEALTLRRNPDGTGELYMATERYHAIYAFPYPLADLRTPGRELDLPPALRQLRHNKGMEAIAFANSGPLSGTLVVVSERGQTFNSNLPGFLLGGPTPGTFTVLRQDSYDATDATFLDNGDMVLLERRFTLRHGVGMRVRLLPAAELKPGAMVVGRVLLEAGFSEQIDNMEGVAIHRNDAGETILTIISDDNRSILQRTLLLRFRIDG
ncbi:esterase-like activity of phytase family protein [Stappia sp. 28M-7]|uniref:esterase-like activity of phytase family protein n=1 Tax=Stappia sp. 28M-7 TaxID=2762596 RepID=UPI00163CAAB1|nr:esterase-like activity of phytase family protein [Stappia sp. 28M-7]